jgi:hypothetical protein
MRKYVMAALAVAGLMTAVEAKADDFIGFGVGNSLCYTVENGSAADLKAADDWILGYWSGLNSAQPVNSAASRTGYDTNAVLLASAVDKVCQNHPTWTLSYAVSSVYTATLSRETGN